MGLCRELSARERFERLVEQLVSRGFPDDLRESKEVDWGAYTQAQVRELNDTLEFIRDAVGRAAPEAPPPNLVGRPREYDPRDLAKVVLLQAYFGCSNRLAVGYALVFREKLGLGKDSSYKAIERAFDDGDVKDILRRVFDFTQEPVLDQVEGFTIDWSVLPPRRSGELGPRQEDLGGPDRPFRRERPHAHRPRSNHLRARLLPRGVRQRKPPPCTLGDPSPQPVR